MTEAQFLLLSACIKADRSFRTAVERGEPMVDYNWRGVEIGPITGHKYRTASVLENAGLIEVVNLDGRHRVCAFLGGYDPYDREES